MTFPSINEPLFFHATFGHEDEAVLADEEARHVAAQRLRAGDAIALFNGRGDIARGVVQAIGRRDVRVHIDQRYRVPPAAPSIDLYTAVPKGERFAVLLDMATQLGVNRFIPLQWHRSLTERATRTRERWRRICIEACKQSRRLHVPEVCEPIAVAPACGEAAASGAHLIAAHLSSGARPLAAVDFGAPARFALFIGPEGGITEEEAETLRVAGAQLVLLSSAVLRVETAAVALVTAVTAFGRPCREPAPP